MDPDVLDRRGLAQHVGPLEEKERARVVAAAARRLGSGEFVVDEGADASADGHARVRIDE